MSERSERDEIDGVRQLEAGKEAADVLEAAKSSSLIISSNSCSLAFWDDKLGYQKQMYIASLRSLSPQGGLVSLLDLTILRIYPIGYAAWSQDIQEFKPWNEAEEREAQALWDVRGHILTNRLANERSLLRKSELWHMKRLWQTAKAEFKSHMS